MWKQFLALLIVGCYVAQGQHILNGVAWTPSGNDTRILDNWIGLKIPIALTYAPFCGEWIFSSGQLQSFWNAGQVPMFTFLPQNLNCASSDSGNTAVPVASGAQDNFLHGFFNTTKEWLAGPNRVYGDADDRRMYMRFAHEMNGNWYPWSGDGNAYKQMWVRVFGIAAKWGLDENHVQWVWCPGAEDVPTTNKVEEYYPGSEYVHWIGLDGYNNAKHDSWSKWQEPNEVFDDMLGRINAIAPGKPLVISETGCATDGYTPQDKSAWITNMFSWSQKNKVKMLLWFNIEGGYADYAAFASRNGASSYKSPVSGQTYKVYETYAQGVRSTELATTAGNPRILTDEEFKGSFA